MIFFSLKNWWIGELSARKVLILGLLIINVSSFLPQYFLSTEQVLAQGTGANSFFPNATTTVTGNQSIIPGLHIMSLVNGVKLTWIIISSDNELSVNIRYSGNGSTPAVSLLATALKSSTEPQIIGSSNASAYQRLSGSNTTSKGWATPATIPIKVEGGMSLYDADLIIVMVVPNTASVPTSNSSSLTLH